MRRIMVLLEACWRTLVSVVFTSNAKTKGYTQNEKNFGTMFSTSKGCDPRESETITKQKQSSVSGQ